MTLTGRLVNSGIRWLTRFLCRLDVSQLERIPLHGPFILVGNHINFLEAPVLFTRLQPRPIATFAKLESWDNPVLRYLFNLWGAIPIRRGEADLTALRKGLATLKAGNFLAVTPEGTRSGDGRLQRGHPGVAVMALRSGAPIMPVAYYGNEMFWHNLKRLRRTDFHVVVGRPFYLDGGGARVTRQVRQQMADEIMYQIAALLPSAYRGYYANMDAATETYLCFPKAIKRVASEQ